MMFQKIMDKMSSLEKTLSEKVEKDTFAALEERVKVLEEKQPTTEPIREKRH